MGRSAERRVIGTLEYDLGRLHGRRNVFGSIIIIRGTIDIENGSETARENSLNAVWIRRVIDGNIHGKRFERDEIRRRRR